MLYRYQGSLYLGISATTWLEAPLAADGLEVQNNGITYTAVGSSDKPDHVWWVKDGVLYWVSNTLTYTVDGDDLLRVAESMRPVDDVLK